MQARSFLAAVLLWAGLSALPAGAQSSAQSVIENFSFELRDLDPNDGISPSLTFVPNDGASSVSWEIFDDHFGGVEYDRKQSSQPMGAVSDTVLRSAEPHTRSELSAQVSGPAVRDWRLSANASMVDTVGENMSRIRAQAGMVAFILSPNTSLFVTADMAVHAQAGPLAGPGLSAIGAAYAYMSLSSWRDGTSSVANLLHNAVFGEDRGPGWADRVTVSLENRSAAASDYSMYMEVASTAYTQAVIPAPIPEPASVALLLAGLGIIGARVRGRPAAAQ